MMESTIINPNTVNAEHPSETNTAKHIVQFAELEGKEVKAQRRENIKDFDLGNGRHQAIIYPHAVHYYEDGNQNTAPGWKEIDNTLEQTLENGRAVMRNRANSISVTLPQESDNDALIKLNAGGHELSWRITTSKAGALLYQIRRVEAEVVQGHDLKSVRAFKLSKQEQRQDLSERESEVTYSEIAPGISVKYRLYGENVKEDIIVSNSAAMADAQIEVHHENARLIINSDKSVSVLDMSTDDELFTFDPPICYDAVGARDTADIQLHAADDNQYVSILRYQLSEDYLRAAVWPVTIDPVVHSSQSSANISDNDVTSKAPSTVQSNTNKYLRVAKSSSSDGTCYSYIRHNSLPIIDGSCTITKAYLKLALNESQSSSWIVNS